MNIKKILLILFLCLFPNYSHAYVDPGIFALVWQSIIAFLFASLAYFRFFYIKTTNILNNFSSVFNKKPFILIFDFFLISLALIVPILEVIKKNSIYFDLSDYAYAFITLLVLFFIVLLFVYFVLFFFNKKKKYSLTLTIFVIISSYFITSLEEVILINFLTGQQVIYFTIFMGLLIPIITIFLLIFLVRFKLNSLKIFLFSFLIILLSISTFNLIKKENFDINDNNELWSNNIPDYSKTDIKDNIYFIMTNAYLSPNYFNILYPNEENEFFTKLRENNFYIKYNSLSNYSSSRFSIPSIFNANYFSEDLKREKYVNSFDAQKNILDESFLIKSLDWNDYNKKFLWCDFQYIFKRKFCDEKQTYLTLMEDIKIIDSIYYYSSIYRISKSIKLFLYNWKIFSIFADRFTMDKDEDIILAIKSEIKKFKNSKNNFLNIYFELPHVPWILNRDCSWKNIPLSENVKNGILIRDENKRINGYIDNLKCVNRYLIEIIDIISEHDDEAIIIFLSDNGPYVRPYKYLNDKISRDELKLYDSTSSILTMGGGSKCLKNISSKDFIHVNLFRIILSCDSTDGFKLLSNNIYLDPIIENKFNFNKVLIND